MSNLYGRGEKVFIFRQMKRGSKVYFYNVVNIIEFGNIIKYFIEYRENLSNKDRLLNAKVKDEDELLGVYDLSTISGYIEGGDIVLTDENLKYKVEGYVYDGHTEKEKLIGRVFDSDVLDGMVSLINVTDIKKIIRGGK